MEILQHDSVHSLCGTWHLLSCVALDRNGQETHGYGQHPIGHLVYTADGWVSVAIMRDPSNLPADPPAADNTVQGVKSGQLIAYIGTYRIEGNNVMHDIKSCTIESWVGDTQERRFSLENTILTLSIDAILVDQTVQSARLTWKRL